MDKQTFTKDEIKKLATLLNVLANEASFSKSIPQFIETYNLLEWANQSLIPKMKSHIFEVKEVIDTTKPAKQKAPK